jgi:hypothetical protein
LSSFAFGRRHTAPAILSSLCEQGPVQPSIKAAFFFNLKSARWSGLSVPPRGTGRVTRTGASSKCRLDQDAIADLSWRPE